MWRFLNSPSISISSTPLQFKIPAPYQIRVAARECMAGNQFLVFSFESDFFPRLPQIRFCFLLQVIVFDCICINYSHESVARLKLNCLHFTTWQRCAFCPGKLSSSNPNHFTFWQFKLHFNSLWGRSGRGCALLSRMYVNSYWSSLNSNCLFKAIVKSEIIKINDA